MKQLKFNPDKDMKELLSYGFEENEHGGYTYKIPDYVNNYQKKYLHCNRYGYFGIELYESYHGFEIPTIIYDLIKANLLIVEESEK